MVFPSDFYCFNLCETLGNFVLLLFVLKVITVKLKFNLLKDGMFCVLEIDQLLMFQDLNEIFEKFSQVFQLKVIRNLFETIFSKVHKIFKSFRKKRKTINVKNHLKS